MKHLWTKKSLVLATNATDPSNKFLSKNRSVSGISIDDRTLKNGDLFIAIKGDKFDGHDFIDSAISKGANGVIVSNKKQAIKYNALLVKDTKTALKNIAKFARKRFIGKIIAITGSSGKTTTKNILANTLEHFGKTHASEGNHNNFFGVSLTLSRLPEKYNFCVLELGMNHAGEIKELTQISKPDIALITNVSNSHIENFKNEKNIAKAKSEIFIGLNFNGIAIINSKSIWSDFLQHEAKKQTPNVRFFGGQSNSYNRIKEIIDNKQGSSIFFDDIKTWHLKYLNSILAENALASLAVVKELKLCEKIAVDIISKIKPLAGRGKKITIKFNNNQKSYVIDDSYNANPDSMKASLKNFKKISTDLKNFKTILIIGDMLELGKDSKLIHLELVPLIEKINLDLLITVGFYSELLSKELKVKSYTFGEIDPLLIKIKKIFQPKQLILIKGSNGMGLWKLIKIFRNYNQEDFNAA